MKNKTLRAGRHSHTYRDNSRAFLQSAMAFADCYRSDTNFQMRASGRCCVTTQRSRFHKETFTHAPSFSTKASVYTSYHFCCSVAHSCCRVRRYRCEYACGTTATRALVRILKKRCCGSGRSAAEPTKRAVSRHHVPRLTSEFWLLICISGAHCICAWGLVQVEHVGENIHLFRDAQIQLHLAPSLLLSHTKLLLLASLLALLSATGIFRLPLLHFATAFLSATAAYQSL